MKEKQDKQDRLRRQDMQDGKKIFHYPSYHAAAGDLAYLVFFPSGN